MNKSFSKISNLILILTGLTTIGAILIWSPVCKDMIELASGNMTYMKCHYTGQASIILSIVLIVSAIESIFTNSRKSWTIMAIGAALIAITLGSNIGIGVCMKDTMSCHDTALWIRGGGIATMVLGLISLLKGDKIRKARI